MQKNTIDINTGNAQKIIEKIRREADLLSDNILFSAKKEAQDLLDKSKQMFEAEKEKIEQDLQREIAALKEKNSSSLSIEKRKIILNQKNRFVEDVLSLVRLEAEKFRSNKDYYDFLVKACGEGARVIGSKDIEVIYSYCDEAAFTSREFQDKIRLFCSAIGCDCRIEFIKGDFKDIGVIIQSQDTRLIYDNRFESRLKRGYDEIFMELLQEALQE
jgi:vacuolar-type H+-ATPase subunit E/Vma4